MTTESQRCNCFTRNGGNAIPKHASPEAKGSNPTAGLTLLGARNPFRGNFNHWQVPRACCDRRNVTQVAVKSVQERRRQNHWYFCVYSKLRFMNNTISASCKTWNGWKQAVALNLQLAMGFLYLNIWNSVTSIGAKQVQFSD